MSTRYQIIEDLILFLDSNSSFYEIKFEELQTTIEIKCSIPVDKWEFLNIKRRTIQSQINLLNQLQNKKEFT